MLCQDYWKNCRMQEGRLKSPGRKETVIRFHIPIAALLLAAISVHGDINDEHRSTIRAEVRLVNVVFSVFDNRNRIAPGLTADDFLVFEDATPQKIQHFSTFSKGDIPLTIALLVDTSASIRDKLDYEKQTAAEFLRNIVRKEKDSALLIQFNSEVSLVHDFTDDPEELIPAISSLNAGGSTALYDAMFLAANEKLRGKTGRKVMVVITDGDDTVSEISRGTVIEMAQKQDVLIYGIGIRSDYFPARFEVLKEFANQTGGRFISSRATTRELQGAFQLIGQELRSQYSLAYTSTNIKRDGAYRSIKVQCKRGGIRIRARKGYYAPTS
jgi:VWFA-related protein